MRKLRPPRTALVTAGTVLPLEVTAHQGDGKVTLVILNRSTSAVSASAPSPPWC
ncbi:hypothetical protein [Micromonospora sp. NPDC049240]|uniref:hypothetical protein n=1 Tax=Micromonospora sp. NPDC049240 TaxID=3155151 RepID=UPI0033EFCDBE